MISTRRWLGTATAILLGATMISTAPSGAHAAPANDVTTAVQHKLLEEAAVAADQAFRTAGLADTRVNVTRRDGRAWAFGTAVLVAPQEEGLYPSGWIFVARQQRGDWQVAFEGEATFAELTAAAPASVVAATGKGRLHRPRHPVRQRRLPHRHAPAVRRRPVLDPPRRPARLVRLPATVQLDRPLRR